MTLLHQYALYEENCECRRLGSFHRQTGFLLLSGENVSLPLISLTRKRSPHQRELFPLVADTSTPVARQDRPTTSHLPGNKESRMAVRAVTSHKHVLLRCRNTWRDPSLSERGSYDVRSRKSPESFVLAREATYIGCRPCHELETGLNLSRGISELSWLEAPQVA